MSWWTMTFGISADDKSRTCSGIMRSGEDNDSFSRMGAAAESSSADAG